MVDSTPLFKSSLDVYNWISGFVNIERGQSVRSFRLDRMSFLSEAAGRPERCAPSIHVAGSKGKGSVTGMTAAILEAAGIRTACYASPHVSDFRERLMMGNKFFDDDILTRAGKELRELVENLPSAPEASLFDPKNENGEEPSFFELMTLWFFLSARLAGCSAMAVETGMGGRLDSTNILDPLVSVITAIELEHTEYLGNTIAAITGEKAGIIKPGRPVVLAEQCDEALAVFRENAGRKKSPFLYFPDCADVNDVRVSREGTSFSLTLKNYRLDDLFVPICGKIQAKNAALAILAVKTAFPDITDDAIRDGLGSITLPARFEKICESPVFIIDGAHTRQSAALVLETFTALYGKKGILVFGCAEGKDVKSMAGLCVPCFSKIIITTPGTFKKSRPEDIHAVFVSEAEKINMKQDILLIPQTKEALDKAVVLAKENNCPVLATGSFYLAGEIKAIL